MAPLLAILDDVKIGERSKFVKRTEGKPGRRRAHLLEGLLQVLLPTLQI